MITINGKEYRNLEEQVLKNMDDIEQFKSTAELLGCEIINHVNSAADLPDPATYDGIFGQCYAVGASSPYDIYVWLEDSSWFNIGKFPLKGDTGATGADGADGRDGNKIYISTGAPGVISGAIEGDICIDKTSWNLWRNHSNMWTLVGNIKGAKGDKGDIGVGLETVISLDNNIVRSGGVTVNSGNKYVQWVVDGNLDYTDNDGNPATKNLTVYNRMPIVGDGTYIDITPDTNADYATVALDTSAVQNVTLGNLNEVWGVQPDQGGITIDSTGITVEGSWRFNYGSGAGTNVNPTGGLEIPITFALPLEVTTDNDVVEVGLDISEVSSDLQSDYGFYTSANVEDIAQALMDEEDFVDVGGIKDLMIGKWTLMGEQTLTGDVTNVQHTLAYPYLPTSSNVIQYKAILTVPASTYTSTGIVQATINNETVSFSIFNNLATTSETRGIVVNWYNDGTYIKVDGVNAKSSTAPTAIVQNKSSQLNQKFADMTILKVSVATAATQKIPSGSTVKWYVKTWT